MRFPKELRYTKDHEWAKAEGGPTGQIVTIGITDHAQRSLGDIVFVELPSPGRALKEHEAFGVVESIKAVSDLYAPIAGKVKESNTAISDNPGATNQDPYGSWLIRLEGADMDAFNRLMDADTYAKYVESLK